MNTKELEAIVRLKKELEDAKLLAYIPDTMILEFVRGILFGRFKKRKLEKALQLTFPIVKACAEWRKVENVSEISADQLPKRDAWERIFGKANENIRGYDENGRPVVVQNPIHKQDFDILLKEMTAMQIFQNTMFNNESMRRHLEEHSSKCGKRV